MTDFLDTSAGEETSGGKPNFIARVVRSDVTSEEYPGKEEYRRDGATYYDHLYELEPLAVKDRETGEFEATEWKNQNEFSIMVTNNYQSKWMVFVEAMEEVIGGPLGDADIEGLEDVSEWLTGKVFEFREITWSEDEPLDFRGTQKEYTYATLFGDSDNQPNEFIIPVKEITDEKMLQQFGQEPDASQVEEVDL